MTDENTQERAATGAAGNAPADVPTGSPDASERTGAVRSFAESGASPLTDEDLGRLDETTPGAPVGGAGTGSIGGAVGGAGAAGTYTAAETSAGAGGGTRMSNAPVEGSPTGAVAAQGGVAGPEGPIAGEGRSAMGGAREDEDPEEVAETGG